jgi:hypothetical protein
VAVVEDEDGAIFQPRAEPFKEVAGELGDAKKVLGGEERQWLAAARSGFLAGEAEVVEERGQVGVAGVDLVPEARRSAALHVAGE